MEAILAPLKPSAASSATATSGTSGYVAAAAPVRLSAQAPLAPSATDPTILM